MKVNSLEGYISGSTLRISVSNFPELVGLIDKAKKEADALCETLHQLSNFGFNVDFDITSVISSAVQKS